MITIHYYTPINMIFMTLLPRTWGMIIASTRTFFLNVHFFATRFFQVVAHELDHSPSSEELLDETNCPWVKHRKSLGKLPETIGKP